MPRRSLVAAIVIGLTVSLAVTSLGVAPSVQAQDRETASLEVHSAICPEDYDGGEYFNDCHSNGIEGHVFALDGPDGHREETTVILDNPGPGIAIFGGIATAGTYTLIQVSPPVIADFSVYCARANDDTFIPVTPINGGISLDLALGAYLVCDWYTLPVSQGGEEPPTSKDQCKRGGWRDFETPRRFQNQGECVSFVQTGK